MAVELLLGAFFVLFGVVGLPLLCRPERTPSALWIGGWVAAGMSSLLLLFAPELRWLGVVSYPLGTLFAFLLLAGTLVWVGRPHTRQVITAGLAWGGARMLAATVLGAKAAYGMALVVEPLVVIAAGVLAWRYRDSGGPRFDGRLLAATMFTLAAAGASHVSWLYLGGGASLTLVALWLALTPPLLGLQLLASAAFLRRSLETTNDALEGRILERTAQLATSEERWRTVSELGSDLSFAYRIDPEGGIHVDWVSDAVQKLTGYSKDEMLDNLRLRVIHPEDRERVLAALPFASGGECDLAFRALCRDNGVRWLDARFRVRREADGNVILIGAARDVTAAHEAEEASRRLELQMLESQRLESLGLLSGGIAHDFNNLLTVILGNARLALADLGNDEALQQRLVRILAAAEHGAALTDQMVVYAGRGSHVRKPANLSEIVQDMMELLRVSLPPRCELAYERGVTPGARSTRPRSARS